MGAKDADTRKLAKVVEHPIRARIIELLGQRGSLGWKELSQEVGVKTGALYHHLDTLEGLIERDSSKKYSLTKAGRIVYARISQGQSVEAVKAAAIDLKREGRGGRVVISIFVPRSILTSLTESRIRSLLVIATSVVLLGTFVVFARFAPYLYYLQPSSTLLDSLAGLLVSLAAVIAAGYASARLVLKSSVQPMTLGAVAAVSFGPAALLSASTLIPSISALFAASTAAYTLALVFFESWSATILGAGLSVATGVRVERTLLVSLAIIYATMVVMLVQGKSL